MQSVDGYSGNIGGMTVNVPQQDTPLTKLKRMMEQAQKTREDAENHLAICDANVREARRNHDCAVATHEALMRAFNEVDSADVNVNAPEISPKSRGW